MTNNSTDTPLDACPYCGCQIKDPFGMGKTIHNVENCKRNRQLAEAKADVKRLKNDFNRLKTLMHQTIWFVDDMIKTHTNGCEHCHKKHGAMIALFKDITEEPQWPINPTNK